MSWTVYRLYDIDDRLIYVGCTGELGRRLSHHRCTQPWWSEVDYFSQIEYETKDEASAVEREAIKREEPLYNKTYRLCLDGEGNVVNLGGRPKGPEKERLLVTVLKTTADYFRAKGVPTDRSATTMAGEHLDQWASNAAKAKKTIERQV